MLKEINSIILDIYQKSFVSDLINYRDYVCETINKVIAFDTISWDYIDDKNKVSGTICSPLFEIEKKTKLSEQVTLDTKVVRQQSNCKTHIITIEYSESQLTATFSANSKILGQRIRLIRKASTPIYTHDDKKLFELIFPHAVEGLSMVLMSSFNKLGSNQAIGIIDKNHIIIDASENFVNFFSSIIKNNKLLLNTTLNQQSISINKSRLTITQVAELFIIHVSIDVKQDLTVQENKVMLLLATGATNKAIAESLKLSPSTINNHLTNIFEKFNVNNRISAVNKWKNQNE